jgi:hypothetical protein
MTKNSVLLTTAYLPPISWFSLLLHHTVILEKQETYARQSYRNRCHIYSERGILPLSVPVTRLRGHHTRIDDVQIYNGEKWYLKHWRAIQSAYEASPYFLYYQDELKPFYSGKYQSLWAFNKALTETLCALMDISPRWEVTTTYEKHPENGMDLRQAFSPKKPLSRDFPPYTQVFSDRHGFLPNLSILDLLFNLGPESKSYLSHIRLPF